MTSPAVLEPAVPSPRVKVVPPTAIVAPPLTMNWFALPGAVL
jgi:hypothetical protein